jgi:hypothetical protein
VKLSGQWLVVSGQKRVLTGRRVSVLAELRSCRDSPGGRLYISIVFLFFFFDFDAEGFEEFEILVADFEFGVGGEGGDEGSLVRGFFALLADADGGFEDQENVIAAVFDAGDDFGDLFGLGERLVDGFAELLHELLELLVHLVPRLASAWAANIPHA